MRFMDALAHYRQRQGLVASSLNLGPVAEGGMAAQVDESVGQRRWAQMGIRPLIARRCNAVCRRRAEGGAAQAVVMEADWQRLAQRTDSGALLSELAQVSKQGGDAGGVRAGGAAEAAERREGAAAAARAACAGGGGRGFGEPGRYDRA